MQTRTLTAAGLSVVCLLAIVASTSCEDTGITAPEGSSITLVALPANISIDQDAGESAGTSQLRAQLLDSSGLPQRDVPLSFTTTGGVLASISNVCIDLGAPGNATCLQTRDPCVRDSDCPVTTPVVRETDINGIVSDTLVLRLFRDPDSVEVTVQSTASATTISVGTNVNTGPEDPRAVLEVRPERGARTGSPITFDGSNSTFALTSPITCFEYDIDARSRANDEIVRTTSPSLNRNYGNVGQRAGEEDLTVTLRVSDQANITCIDGESIQFSQFQDVISYEVRCDFDGDLIVNGGPNRSASLGTDTSVTVVLNAAAFDVNSSTLIYTWDCGNSQVLSGQSVNCVYTAAQQEPYQARITVENTCGRIVTDSVLVTINQ